MSKKDSRASVLKGERCVHHEREWKGHPELTRLAGPLGACYCIVCMEWIRAQDTQKFLKYVRAALAEGKSEEEIAQELELDGIADPFAEPPRSYLNILLAKSKYAITDGRLKRVG